MPCAVSTRCSQNPSRPASKQHATSTGRPGLVDARDRRSSISVNSAAASPPSRRYSRDFSTPGSRAATSQVETLSSIATRIVIPDGMMANSLIPDGMMANSLIRRGPGAVARRFAHGRLLDDPMSTYEPRPQRVKQKLTLPERRCLLQPARRNHMSSDPTIIYTLTDEAPLLATYALLPIIRTFTTPAGVRVEESDISLAARILSCFPEYLTAEQRVPETLTELGRKTLDPDANIIKLPNISASVPQLLAAIKELQAKGYKVPDYPGDPKTDEEKAIKARYAKCIGSAVNPVLREGNSDRRAPRAVKEYARKNPHSMAEWAQASRTHVSHMHSGDFYHGEKSMTLDRARDVKMELITKSGTTLVLKPKVALLDGEIIDS